MPFKVDDKSGISAAYRQVRSDAKAIPTAYVHVAGDSYLKSDARDATTQDRQDRMKETLIRLIVNEVAQSEKWSQAVEESGEVREALRQMASKAVAHIVPKRGALRLEQFGELRNVAQRLTLDEKGDFVAASLGGAKDAAELLSTRLHSAQFRQTPVTPARLAVSAARPRSASCPERACARVSSGIAWAAYGSAHLLHQLYQLLPPPHAAAFWLVGTPARASLAAQVPHVLALRRGPPAAFKRATAGHSGLQNPESVRSYLCDVWHGRRVAKSHDYAAVHDAVREKPNCAIAAVEQIYAEVGLQRGEILFWQGVAPFLLDAPASVLEHVFLTDEQCEGLRDGAAWMIENHAMPYSLTRGGFAEPPKLHARVRDYLSSPAEVDLVRPYAAAQRTLERNAGRLNAFLESRLALDDSFDGAPLHMMIEYFEATEAVGKRWETAQTLDEAECDALEAGRDLPQREASMPASGSQAEGEAAVAMAREAEADDKSGDGPAQPRKSRGHVRDGKEESIPASPQPRAVARRGPKSTRLCLNPRTGKWIWRSSHHPGGKNKSRKNADRDAMGRPGKSWNHKLAVDHQRAKAKKNLEWTPARLAATPASESRS